MKCGMSTSLFAHPLELQVHGQPQFNNTFASDQRSGRALGTRPYQGRILLHHVLPCETPHQSRINVFSQECTMHNHVQLGSDIKHVDVICQVVLSSFMHALCHAKSCCRKRRSFALRQCVQVFVLRLDFLHLHIELQHQCDDTIDVKLFWEGQILDFGLPES